MRPAGKPGLSGSQRIWSASFCWMTLITVGGGSTTCVVAAGATAVAAPGISKAIGNAVLPLPGGLREGAPIEITFRLNTQGLLEATARELSTNRVVDVRIETASAMSELERAEAKARSTRLVVS